MPQGIPHFVAHDRRACLRVIAVHFHAHVFGINLLHLLGFPAHLPARSDTPYRSCSEALCREFAVKAPGWQLSAASELQRVLLFLLRHEGARFRPLSKSCPKSALLPRLLPALQCIEQNLSDLTLSVDLLAEPVHLSEVQFRKLFRQATGCSPVQFI